MITTIDVHADIEILFLKFEIVKTCLVRLTELCIRSFSAGIMVSYFLEFIT